LHNHTHSAQTFPGNAFQTFALKMGETGQK